MPNYILIKDISLSLSDTDAAEGVEVKERRLLYTYHEEGQERLEHKLLLSDGFGMHPASPAILRTGNGRILYDFYAESHPSFHSRYDGRHAYGGVGTLPDFLALLCGYNYGSQATRPMELRGTFAASDDVGIKEYVGRQYIRISEEVDVQDGSSKMVLHELRPQLGGAVFVPQVLERGNSARPILPNVDWSRYGKLIDSEEAKRLAAEEAEAKAEEAKRHAEEEAKARAKETREEAVRRIKELSEEDGKRYRDAMVMWGKERDKASEALRTYTDEKTAEAKNYARTWNEHSHTFDLRALDPTKYYAAVIQLPTSVNINQPDRYNIVVYAGLDKSIPKPPYATHVLGFSAELRWSVSAQGNGARYEGRVVESYGTASVKAGEQVMSQPYHSGVLRSEYVYLRGGYVYQCRVTSDFAPNFELAATDFAVAGRNAVITSPVDSITPPKSDTDRLRDSIDEGDRATLAGAKAYADGHLARGRSEVHDEVNILKTQIAGKMQHFIGSSVPTGYRKGDLWTLTADWTSFKAGSVLVADADELAGRYTPRHWQELWGFRREAKEAVRDLQLGGVQLLRSPWSTQEREQDGGAHLVRFGYELPAGTYTLSGDMEVKRKGNGMRIIPTPFKEYFEGHRDEWGILLAFPEGGRFEMTFTAKRSFDGFYLYPSQAWTSPGDPKAGHVVFRRLKIERGNKATDWSPAPEDTELLIDERVKAAKAELLSEMSQQREALEARIAALEAKASRG